MRSLERRIYLCETIVSNKGRADLIKAAEQNNCLMSRLITAAKQTVDRTRQLLESLNHSPANGEST